jgi:type II secretory pathway pseudopilin PulG
LDRLRKDHFTLLEILIVVLILSMGVVLTGVKLKKAYEEQRFSSDCQIIINQLTLAQDLMLIMDADVYVILERHADKKITCSLEIEKPLRDSLSKVLERPFVLSAIESYEFEKKSDSFLKLVFSLGNMSRGELTLISPQNERRTIYLPGYPNPIGKQALDKEEDRITQSEALYPAEIYEEIYPQNKK